MILKLIRRIRIYLPIAGILSDVQDCLADRGDPLIIQFYKKRGLLPLLKFVKNTGFEPLPVWQQADRGDPLIIQFYKKRGLLPLLKFVENTGFEPVTLCMPCKYSTN